MSQVAPLPGSMKDRGQQSTTEEETSPLIKLEAAEAAGEEGHAATSPRCICLKCKYVGEQRGNVLICCRSIPGARPQCVIGPHWPHLVMTYLGIGGGSAYFCYFLIMREAKLEFMIFGLCLMAVVLVSLALLAFVDPGIVQGHMVRKGRSHSEMWSYCERCSTFRPPRTIHCNECQVCIEQYDHHCPWTGKCVGKNNIWFFNIFVTTLICCIIYDISIGLTVLLQG